MPKRAITTPKAKAIGPYSAAVESGDLIFVSGQIPLDSAVGKLVEGDIAAQTRQSLENLKTILTAAGLTFAHVVKTTIFLTSMGDFAAVNEVYKSYVARALPRALDHCRRRAADGRQGRDRDDCLAQRRLNARSRTHADERPRVPGQAAAASVRSAGGAGRAGLQRGRGGGCRAGAARPRVGGEGTDPRRRPRQGQVQGAGCRRQGRRAPRQVGRRGESVRRADAGQDAGDDPDRSRRSRVKRLFIEDGCEIARELYLSALVDRATSRISFIVSTEGGMDIEKVAHDTPDRIVTLSIDPASGYSAFHGRRIASALKLDRRPDRAVREAGRPALSAPSSTRT